MLKIINNLIKLYPKNSFFTIIIYNIICFKGLNFFISKGVQTDA